MNSRWHANKIGLLNFWYYDEQEFPFIKGRMLLRGSNGSGKSVTMQSVVPLLLDGNMSPERLDPFGSRDRKMSSYLLEENDGREERTGYLYLEFKREESDTYLTIGMGIRARRGKPLEKWYFSLTDGRRIGKDFFLYKELDEKIPLSKKELQYRVQGGGHVFDKQQEYMEYVNRKIFGFDTAEEYKEMIDLLIQLRTPKLSKDFKPSVINEILCDSLQPLSDDDLRPMSEAIENMDTMSMNMKARQDAKLAAEKINRVLDKYNRLILLEKAEILQRTSSQLEECEKTQKKTRENITQGTERVLQLGKLKEELNARKNAMEAERESLSKSDAVELKEKERKLEDEIKKCEGNLREKENALNRKNDQYFREKSKYQEEQGREYEKSKELHGLLEDMQIPADDMAFQEHDFLIDEMEKNLKGFKGFSHYDAQFEKTKEGIRDGLDILTAMELDKERLEELKQRREQLQKETDTKERRERELEAVLVQIENEWIESLYDWNQKNSELVLPKEDLKELSRFVETYSQDSDYSIIKRKVYGVWSARHRQIDEKRTKNSMEIQELKELCREQENALREWENQKEPVPLRSEEVQRNRERLQNAGIPYIEFYKVIEFAQTLSPEECNRIEEAFLHMGILDALVIDEKYKEQALQTEKGCRDTYLFRQEQKAEHSVMEVLELNDGENLTFCHQQLREILESISYFGGGNTAILKNGTYQMGIATGTLSGEYEAGYLGTKARERNRLSKIAACREKIKELELGLQTQEEIRSSLEQRILKLEEEHNRFPKEDDLHAALNMLLNAQRQVEQMKENISGVEMSLKEVLDKVKEQKTKAMEIADRLYLKCSYPVFVKAEQSARLYAEQYIRLKSGYEVYIDLIRNMEERTQRIEELEQDIDEIRYDISQAEKEKVMKKEEQDSVKIQLSLTDYEQIRQRLDGCLLWLKNYPSELVKVTEERTQRQEQVRLSQEKLAEDQDKIQKLEKKKQYEEQCYLWERNLEYVDFPEGIQDNLGSVITCLQSEKGSQKKETIVGELNRVYFENKSFLNDYQPVLKELFSEAEGFGQDIEEAAAGRLDISARYQGVEIPFRRLLVYLEQDIEELKGLIQDGDRELFEDILGNTVSRKIRAKINTSNAWVSKMNGLMGAMNTSSGLKLCLRWRSRTAEEEDQLDTKDLVDLLKKDYRLMKEEEAERLSRHFRSKVEIARRSAKDSGGMVSFYQVMKETLDYRKWFEFQLFYQKTGEKQKELTNSVFGTFSGGEKAMSMYVPLFSAVVAKYQGGGSDAPKLISLDEAFAGVDNQNIRDMFRLMSEFQFDFIINSQVLWGDCDTLDALAIYQLIRPENAKFVTVMCYLWNGHKREMMENEEQLERRARSGN